MTDESEVSSKTITEITPDPELSTFLAEELRLTDKQLGECRWRIASYNESIYGFDAGFWAWGDEPLQSFIINTPKGECLFAIPLGKFDPNNFFIAI